MKTIVNVKFKSLLNEDDLKSTTFGDMPLLAEVPGLISKTFYVNPNTSYLGAIYQFEDEKAADFYLNSPFFKDLENRYKIAGNTLSVEKVQIALVLKGLNTANSNGVTSLEWSEITSKDTLENAILKSGQRPVIIFKHSNRCPVSRSVLRRLDGFLEQDASTHIECYLLDVISFRNLSDNIAEKFGVKHASPQVLLIKNSSCIYHSSQTEIDGAQIIEKANTFTHYQPSN